MVPPPGTVEGLLARQARFLLPSARFPSPYAAGVAPPRSVVQVVVGTDLAELAADALWQARPSAVLEVDLDDGRVRLTADVADPTLIDARWSPEVLAVDDDGYLDAWRSWAVPIRAGRRLVVHPAWVPRDDGHAAGAPTW